jgi:hypothetical protein
LTSGKFLAKEIEHPTVLTPESSVTNGHRKKGPYISYLGWVGFGVGLTGYIGPSSLTLTHIIPKTKTLSRIFFEIGILSEKAFELRKVIRL